MCAGPCNSRACPSSLNPSLPQSQIVSLILSGGGGGSTLQMLQATPAEQSRRQRALTQGGAMLAAGARPRIGLPDIGVETDLNNETSLVLGQYLSPRLYVSYGVGLTEQFNAIKLRYSLGDHWVVRTEGWVRRGSGPGVQHREVRATTRPAP